MTDVHGLRARALRVAPRPAPPTAGPARAVSQGAGNYLALVPFHAYVGLFLILPTLVVLVGAFTTTEGQFTLDNFAAIFTTPSFVDSFVKSIQLAVITALLGAVVGGLLAWAVVRGDPQGTAARADRLGLRRPGAVRWRHADVRLPGDLRLSRAC